MAREGLFQDLDAAPHRHPGPLARVTNFRSPAVDQMLPPIALVGPLYVFFTGTINVYNTYVALIMPYLVIALPVTVYFLNVFFPFPWS